MLRQGTRAVKVCLALFDIYTFFRNSESTGFSLIAVGGRGCDAMLFCGYVLYQHFE